MITQMNVRAYIFDLLFTLPRQATIIQDTLQHSPINLLSSHVVIGRLALCGEVFTLIEPNRAGLLDHIVTVL